jgi:hypothetical protein
MDYVFMRDHKNDQHTTFSDIIMNYPKISLGHIAKLFSRTILKSG